MTERGGIFAGEDPFALARAWLAEATRSEPEDANAIALATVDPTGLPNVRMVLLKDIEPDAFVFYTNFDSAKGQELAASGTAAFVAHWKSLRRQLRVRGHVSGSRTPRPTPTTARARSSPASAPGPRASPARSPRARR
jgi:pyridoxamine 5'-phosphate oxidase